MTILFLSYWDKVSCLYSIQKHFIISDIYVPSKVLSEFYINFHSITDMYLTLYDFMPLDTMSKWSILDKLVDIDAYIHHNTRSVVGFNYI